MELGNNVADTIERLLEEPCWVVDFLPKQVPSESAGQFPAIERHYLEPANRS